MLHEIQPAVFSNAYRDTPPLPSSQILFCQGATLLLARQDNTIRLPRLEELPDQAIPLIYAFAIDGDTFYLAATEEAPELEGFRLEPANVLRLARPRSLAFAGALGCQLGRWYGSRRFCGRCATPLERDSRERMLRCPACGLTEYPKLSPAVIVGVKDGDRLLLTKYANRSYRNYALIAGFAELGEAVEETVQREVAEEVGLKVRNITYYRSQPWPFSDTLLFGFFADLDGDPTIRMDDGELATAFWMPRDKIRVSNHNLSLTNEMMYRFATGVIR